MFRRWLILTILCVSPLVMVSAQDDDDTYTVQAGESLREIAVDLNVNLACLMDANGIANPSLISPGDVLDVPLACVMATEETIPLGEMTPEEIEEEDAASLGQGGGAVIEAGDYTVSRGDTLARIALAYETTVTCIATTNNIRNPNLIFIGQVLTITDSCIGISAGQGGGGTVSQADQICRGDRNPGRETTNGVYVVRYGDMLDFIGCDFGLQTRCLAEVNNLHPVGAIEIGQPLIIDFSCSAWDGPPGPGDLNN